MRSASRAIRLALVVGIAASAAACGTGSPSAATAGKSAIAVKSAAGAPATTSAPVTPIAWPTLAPAPSEDAAVGRFGQSGVQTGYRELTDLATHLAFNKDYFLDDGNNKGSDLDPVLAGRTYSAQTDHVRSQADACHNGDDKACADVIPFAYFDFGGGDGHTLTYRTDGAFVAEQSVTNPTVALENIQGQDTLRYTFDHTAKVRLMLDGKPITVTMIRNLTYHLWPAETGNPTQWWIVNWNASYHPTIVDEATGQQVKS
jgi:hypothetical protein